MKELFASIRKNAVGLGLFAVVTAGAIAVAQVGTKERIQQNIRAAEARALNEIVPIGSYDNNLLTDVTAVDERFNQQLLGPLKDDAAIHIARRDGEISTLIFPVVAPDGYTTVIDMLVGINADGTVAGVRVVAHRETPGLGDKVDLKKSDWVLEFNGKSLFGLGEDEWAVKKDGGAFDQFTGATITPRAVVGAVKHALQFFELHKAQLLSLPVTDSSEEQH